MKKKIKVEVTKKEAGAQDTIQRLSRSVEIAMKLLEGADRW